MMIRLNPVFSLLKSLGGALTPWAGYLLEDDSPIQETPLYVQLKMPNTCHKQNGLDPVYLPIAEPILDRHVHTHLQSLEDCWCQQYVWYLPSTRRYLSMVLICPLVRRE
jgi:hypothetical protein